MTELSDLFEESLHIARVLAKQSAFQKQRVLLRSAVAHIAVTHDALVGIYPDNRSPEHDSADLRDAHICDLQISGRRIPVHLLRSLRKHFFNGCSRECCETYSAKSCFFQERATSIGIQIVFHVV